MVKKALRRENIWLNDVSLRDVDARIINVRLIEEADTLDLTYAQMAGRSGRMALARRAVSKKIGVEFMARELYDLAARTAIIDAVNAWAGVGGEMRCSTRPEQVIRLVTTGYASAGDIRDYTAALRLDFETAAVPAWESDTPATYTATGASGSGQMAVGGNAETWADVRITSRTAILTSASVTFGGSTITIEGFELASGYALSLWHDDNGILRATSAMPPYHYLQLRTRESADDLTGGPGIVPVAFTANTACDVIISARGRYL